MDQNKVILLGYLTQVNQASRVMTLYGIRLSNLNWEYFAKHEYHPGLRLKIDVKDRPLKDLEMVKVFGYGRPFRVNLYEYATCCPDEPMIR